MEKRPKTLIVDFDGTLIHHYGSLSSQMSNAATPLPGLVEKFDEWDKKGYKIIILTGRKESMRKITEQQLFDLQLPYDQLVMGVGGGVRVLINDLKEGSEEPTAVAINIKRNTGIKDIDI